MKVLKKYDFAYKFLLFILIFTFLLTLINLIVPLSTNVNSCLSLVTFLLYSLIVGIKKGMKTEEKAYKSGLFVGGIHVLILYLLNCLTFHFGLPIKKIIYFLLIIVTTVLGSIIGINRKNYK